MTRVSCIAQALGLLIRLAPTIAGAQPAPAAPTLDAGARRRAVDSVAKMVRDRYVFARKGDSVARIIVARERSGAYAVTSTPDFAARLTADLRALSNDRHLRVLYEPSSTHDVSVDSAELARRYAVLLREIEATNFGFPEVRVMSGNVGYLAITSVQPPKFAAELFTNAMGFLARTDALILDLRANGGGDAVLPEFILSYFFDEAVLLGEVEQRGVAKPGQAWTYGHVPGHRYGSTRPLFVLTNDSTFSGAEAIAYALQAARRAVVVGERTGGGANAGAFLAIGNGLTLFVPSARLVNPVTRTNWDGVGVVPDIESRSSDALRVAHDSALARLRRQRSRTGATP